MEAIVFIILQIFSFGNAQNLLEDLKIGEYHSTGGYFTVITGAFNDVIRQRCASKNID